MNDHSNTDAARMVPLATGLSKPLAPDQHPLAPVVRHPIFKGWLVHCFTATGAICGMLGLIAVSDYQPREAVLWLAVAMILDGIDGPAARAWDVKNTVPRIDGYTLDLIIDFVTCIVIPVIFLHRFDVLPKGWSLGIGAFVLFMSALWMSRTDQMSDDHWFNGFPCEWNMIVPTLFLLDVNPWAAAVICILLTLTQLTSWKFVHPMQVTWMRPLTVAITITWLASVLWMTALWPRSHPLIGQIMLVACPLYIVGIGALRTIAPRLAGARQTVPAAI